MADDLDTRAERDATVGISSGIFWASQNICKHFGTVEYGFLYLSGGSEEEILTLEIRSAFTAKEFRNRMHDFCEAMRDAEHMALYDAISIFQQRPEATT